MTRGATPSASDLSPGRSGLRTCSSARWRTAPRPAAGLRAKRRAGTTPSCMTFSADGCSSASVGPGDGRKAIQLAVGGLLRRDQGTPGHRGQNGIGQAFKLQRVQHDEDARAGHNRRLEDRLQESKRGQGYGEEIVPEGPHKVGENGPANRAGDVDDPWQHPKSTGGQHYSRGLTSEVSRGPNGNAHVRLGQDRSVIQAIADHRQNAIVLTSPIQRQSLVLRRKGRLDIFGPYPDCSGDPLRS